ncbi:DedA family protein [Amycolatopsis magusensis]|uniref:DedA family protein n=1 Tax=Amycolatopsis magusensis TaxID=882444 RepID=UPI0037A857E7
MDSLLRSLPDLPPPLIYLGCGLLITAETALLPGIVLPTLSTLLLMGGLAEQGTLDLPLALAVAVAAALLGDQLAYLEGHRWGAAAAVFALRQASRRRALEPRGVVHRAVRPPGVIAGRFLAGVRTVVPRVAGSTVMPYRRFGSACAAVVWAGAELLAGHVAASLT